MNSARIKSATTTAFSIVNLSKAVNNFRFIHCVPIKKNKTYCNEVEALLLGCVATYLSILSTYSSSTAITLPLGILIICHYISWFVDLFIVCIGNDNPPLDFSISFHISLNFHFNWRRTLFEDTNDATTEH